MEEKLRTTANFLKDVSLFSSWDDLAVEQLFREIKYFLLGTQQANVPQECKFNQVMHTLAETPNTARYLRILDRVDPSLKYSLHYGKKAAIPLCYAFNDLDNARALIDLDPETMSWVSEGNGTTTIIYAMAASYEAFSLLVDRGCRTHLQSIHETHPLVYALSKSVDSRIVVDILSTNPGFAASVLHIYHLNVYTWMTKHGTFADVRTLHELGCLGFEPYKSSLQPLAQAIIMQNEELVNFFLRFVTQDVVYCHPGVNIEGLTFLHLVADTGNTRILHSIWAVEHFRQHLNVFAVYKGTPFFVAVKRGFKEACLLFLQTSWLPDKNDIFAVINIPNAKDIIECMVQRDASTLNRTMPSVGYSVFVMCALIHRFDNADCFYALGAEVDTTSTVYGHGIGHESPLIIAVKKCNALALEYFLRRGICLKNDRQVSNLVHHAIIGKSSPILHILYNAGAGQYAVGQVDVLLKYHASAKFQSYASTETLREAIRRGYQICTFECVWPSFFYCSDRAVAEPNRLAKLIFAYFGSVNLMSEEEIADERYTLFFSTSLLQRLCWTMDEHRTKYQLVRLPYNLFPQKRYLLSN